MSIKGARQKFARLVTSAERGRTVAITRRGKRVAQIGPAAAAVTGRLPSLAEFRAGIRLRGKPMSGEVVARRARERY